MTIRKQVNNKMKAITKREAKQANQVNNFIVDHIVENMMGCEAHFI